MMSVVTETRLMSFPADSWLSVLDPTLAWVLLSAAQCVNAQLPASCKMCRAQPCHTDQSIMIDSS